MKKHYLLAAAVASLLMVTSCQKDQGLVILGAVINHPSKTYIDNRYPCWNEGDQVYVNTAAYSVSAISGSSAQITDVEGADAYRAIFPASLVTSGSNIANNANIHVTLPATQKYQVVDGHQRVDAPMGAYTEGSTLQFYNLCSIVHVVVNNNTGSDMALEKLRIATDNAYLSGAGTATVSGTDNDGITLSSDASHSVSLRIAGPNSVTLAAGAQYAFDIYVPAFPTDNVTITLYTSDGKYFELTKNNVALVHNTVTTVTLNVGNLSDIVAAELVEGSVFNRAIPDNATSVVFEYNNSTISSGTILSTITSPVPIYGNMDGTTWRVSTAAQIVNAYTSCWLMFANKSSLTEIVFGEGFNTSSVWDMYGMFQGCSGLVSLDLSNFNTSHVAVMDYMFNDCCGLTSLNVSNFITENVSYMKYMFCGCSGLTNLDLANFNTTKVANMDYMFYGCDNLTNLNLSHFNMSKLGGVFEEGPTTGKEEMCYISTISGFCTITCPLAVENAIKEVNPDYDPDAANSYYLTGLPTEEVTFTWVRPTSK